MQIVIFQSHRLHDEIYILIKQTVRLMMMLEPLNTELFLVFLSFMFSSCALKKVKTSFDILSGGSLNSTPNNVLCFSC